MKKIKKLVHMINEELEGAKCYAEKYIEFKVDNKSAWSSKFKEMANDELNHAMQLHTLAIEEITEIKKIYVAPIEMQEKWDKSHEEYVQKVAWIKQMLMM